LDWERYKQICDTPAVFSRWMLEQSCELLSPALCARVDHAMVRGVLDKPAGHRGGTPTDMFVLTLTLEEVESILATILAAEAAGKTTSGTRDRGLGGFAAAWGEYRDSLGRAADVP
jgi:hypothetical protein